jgi:RHS repeat-associated protein
VPQAKTTYTYDGVGNVRTVKDPNGQATGAVTTYNWDEMNRINSIDDPLATGQGHTRRFRYDPGGHLIKEVRADDKMKQYLYDKLGRCYWVLDFGSTWDLVENPPGSGGCSGPNCGIVNLMVYNYDAEDNVTSIQVPGGAQYSFTYDELNRKTSQTYPPDSSPPPRTEHYHYDAANHLDQYINPAGQIKTLGYDSRGRLTSSSWNANGPNVSISYDDTRPTGITTSSYTVPVPGGGNFNCPGTGISFGYDEANNRTYEDQTFAGTTHRVQTDPDPDGSRKNLLVKTGGTVNFENDFDYTSRNELRNIKNSSLQPLFTYSYDANGNVTQRAGRTLSGDTTTTVYDRLNRPTQCTHAIGGANFSTSTYHYTAIGNLTDVMRGSSPYEDGKGDYFNTYNETNELTAVLYSATGPTDPNPGKSVTYEVAGRRRDAMTVTTPTSTDRTSYFHNDLNQYTNIRFGNVDHFTGHDNNFNLTNYNGWTYLYDAENRLVSASNSASGRSAAFVYDAIGRCVRRTITVGATTTTTVLTYDQWTPIVEWDGNGNSTATNIYGLGDDEILYRSSGSTQWYYKSDPMGNVRFLLNSAGAVIEKYVYDAFGSPTITNFNGSSPTTNRFMFSGREYFSSLGLYDMRNRIYDPVMGRFYQTDPIGLASDPTNLYRFCGNNPLLGGDPMGLEGEDFSGDYGGDSSFGGGEGWWYTGGTNSDGSIYGSFYMYQPSAAFSASYDSYLNDIFNTGTNAGISSWAGDGNFLPADSYLPSYASAATHAPSRVSTSVANQGVGQPGLIGSFVPVYGSLRSSIDYFQTGHWGWGTFYAVMTAVDAGTLGGDSLVTGALKGGVRLTQTGLEHIALRHLATSGAQDASKLATGIGARGIRDMIGETVSKGVSRPNTLGRPGTIFEADLGRTIGVDLKGNATSRFRVVVWPDGTVKTAFPIN